MTDPTLRHRFTGSDSHRRRETAPDGHGDGSHTQQGHWTCSRPGPQLLGAPDTADIPGVAFLRMWLRRGTLEPIITRELGRGALEGDWMEDGRARLKACPHWRGGPLAGWEHRDPADSVHDLCPSGGQRRSGAHSQRPCRPDPVPYAETGSRRYRRHPDRADFYGRL